jgi:hypothetical protein
MSLTLFFAGYMGTFVATSLVIFKFMIPEYAPDWIFIGALIFCAALGVIIGLLACMWAKFGLFLVGGWIGGTSGMMFYNAFLAPTLKATGANFFWVFIGICVIAGGILTLILFKHAIIVGSALCGSYCLIRVIYNIINIYL